MLKQIAQRKENLNLFSNILRSWTSMGCTPSIAKGAIYMYIYVVDYENRQKEKLKYYPVQSCGSSRLGLRPRRLGIWRCSARVRRIISNYLYCTDITA